ncbi:serine/arginine-rich splicing factor RS41-like isoform X1 [Salvia splendens]|uniref:serine/arginine-rich splicing factor RS41-like isoform X1 n=1 Tax=Salvia splendens TaxID=180675 RepID=UPI001C272253|nr:serine/arginine-rich splicing factor RS41-like isoform X1 [Salvia splendens]
MLIYVICQKKKHHVFSVAEPPCSKVSLPQDSLDIPQSSSMDGSLRLFSGLCPRYMFLFVRKRTNMICHGPTILHFPPLPFAFLMTLPSLQFPTSFNINSMLIPDAVAGFAFIYMEDERDAGDAIRKLDRIEFGKKRRQLRVEWTKQERGGRNPDSSRKSSANAKPSKTLFVINFDPVNTRTRDLERHFEHYGKISNVRIRRNFAFVQFELQEDATRALESAKMSKFMDRVISVEYATRDDDDKRNVSSPDRRGRDRSPPNGRSYGRGGRSPSPYHRERGSPDYGHGAAPNSRSDRRSSPDYGRAISPVNDRYKSRSPRARERSPVSERSPVPERSPVRGRSDSS